MDPAPAPKAASVADAPDDGGDTSVARNKPRSDSVGSHKSSDSQTAAEFLRDQMQLEADAREALPYSIENCTNALGPLRQAVFACLTCNPPPANSSDPYNAAGVCYACSVQCHGEHTLVEIFNKRNFTCDCGTTRFPSTSPCNLRLNPGTNSKGGVHSQEPDVNNKYNHNFRNRFCGCECDYDPFEQKGTMFQCLGLGTHETGGCGEDWWHPGCVVGMGPKWFEGMAKEKKPKTEEKKDDGTLPTISEDAEALPTQNGAEEEDEEDDDPPLPPGFPEEEDFEAFLCYKCVEAYPWIKRYTGTEGFLPAVYLRPDGPAEETLPDAPANEEFAAPTTKEPTLRIENAAPVSAEEPATTITPTPTSLEVSKKRKASGDDDDDASSQTSKRVKNESESKESPRERSATPSIPPPCKLLSLPPVPPSGKFSLFCKPDFREKLCRCSSCFPLLIPHPQLLEEEETYEPPVSPEASENGSTLGSNSLYERGESALKNVDRVKAIEGVMAYNHLKDKLKPFFKQFAESGQAISAEDIKGYFAKLRGDEEVTTADTSAQGKDGDDNRREESGY
ncbi:putative zinc finger in N-recognin-domain-containing protein [Triangularia verruculosa]|uniref:Zinc finger in N-recognin-domain-containing protein n=1 Tax=Triangularia verruculosa TaxID=2587418 RepID=A0AAN6XKU3_9PEZI|nr:putative zinc finger in N-recognin-domain-containing protein [Triangularia verruculosa]